MSAGRCFYMMWLSNAELFFVSFINVILLIKLHSSASSTLLSLSLLIRFQWWRHLKNKVFVSIWVSSPGAMRIFRESSLQTLIITNMRDNTLGNIIKLIGWMEGSSQVGYLDYEALEDSRDTVIEGTILYILFGGKKCIHLNTYRLSTKALVFQPLTESYFLSTLWWRIEMSCIVCS